MKFIFYFIIFTSTYSATFFGIDTPVGQLTLYRFSVFAMIILIAFTHRGPIILKVKENYHFLFMVFWLIYALATVFWIEDFQGWQRQVFFVFMALTILIVCMNRIQSEEDIRKTIEVFVMGTILQTGLGWYEYFTGDYMYIDKARSITYAAEQLPVALMNNVNDFATLMLVTFIFSLYLFGLEKNHIVKVLCLAYSASCITLILLSGSRANMIALLCVIGFYLLFSGRNKLFVGFLVAAVLLFVPGVSETIQEGTEINFQANSGSDFARMGLIENGFYFVKESYGFGIGAGQIEYYIKYKSLYNTAGATNMHNFWMEILTNYGIVIFIGYLIYYFKLIISAYIKSLKSNTNESSRKLNFTICSVLVGFIISCISSSSSFSAEYLWLLFAVFVSNYKLKFKEA